MLYDTSSLMKWSLSARRAWIEMTFADGAVSGSGESLSARRAWIEIFYYCDHDTDWIVALRKESVDRNTMRRDFKALGLVALRKESVDRNVVLEKTGTSRTESLSARRAWIEIPIPPRTDTAIRRRSPQGERG